MAVVVRNTELLHQPFDHSRSLSRETELLGCDRSGHQSLAHLGDGLPFVKDFVHGLRNLRNGVNE